MSDMTTFTVRDLDRTPSRVLDACDREGEVQVRRRDGTTYRILSPKGPALKRTAKIPDFEARRKLIYGDMKKNITPAQTEEFYKAIASER